MKAEFVPLPFSPSKLGASEARSISASRCWLLAAAWCRRLRLPETPHRLGPIVSCSQAAIVSDVGEASGGCSKKVTGMFAASRAISILSRARESAKLRIVNERLRHLLGGPSGLLTARSRRTSDASVSGRDCSLLSAEGIHLLSRPTSRHCQADI